MILPRASTHWNPALFGKSTLSGANLQNVYTLRHAVIRRLTITTDYAIFLLCIYLTDFQSGYRLYVALIVQFRVFVISWAAVGCFSAKPRYPARCSVFMTQLCPVVLEQSNKITNNSFLPEICVIRLQTLGHCRFFWAVSVFIFRLLFSL